MCRIVTIMATTLLIHATMPRPLTHLPSFATIMNSSSELGQEKGLEDVSMNIFKKEMAAADVLIAHDFPQSQGQFKSIRLALDLDFESQNIREMDIVHQLNSTNDVWMSKSFESGNPRWRLNYEYGFSEKPTFTLGSLDEMTLESAYGLARAEGHSRYDSCHIERNFGHPDPYYEFIQLGARSFHFCDISLDGYVDCGTRVFGQPGSSIQALLH